MFSDPDVFNGHTSNIRCSFYLKDGKQIASSSDDKSIRYESILSSFILKCWNVEYFYQAKAILRIKCTYSSSQYLNTRPWWVNFASG